MNMMRFVAALALAVTVALPARAAVDIQEVTSPGGLKAWLVEDHNIPFTALEVRFRGGSSVEDPAKRGAVNLMTALIEEGTGDMDSLAFAEARDGLAASFSFSSDQDSVEVSAQFLTENRDKAVDLLRQAITAPRFDAEAIERVRGQVLSNLRASAKDPGDMAGKALNAQAFGDHPYATSGDGTVDSVTALTRDDLVAAHQATIARDRIYIAAAGDISAEDLGKLVDTLFGALPETGAPLVGRAPFDLTGGTTVIDYPGPQSVVLWAEQGIKRNDPDFFAASILNEIMGGSRFSARLMTEVREKRGLTYGIGTSLAGYDQAELLAGQSQIPNAKVKDAVDVIKAEWAKMAEQGITAEELAATKTYLTGAYPLRFDGNGPLATIMVNMQLIGLPSDYPKTRNDKVNAVTLEDANRVAKALFRPENLRFIIVGQPEGVASTD